MDFNIFLNISHVFKGRSFYIVSNDNESSRFLLLYIEYLTL